MLDAYENENKDVESEEDSELEESDKKKDFKGFSSAQYIDRDEDGEFASRMYGEADAPPEVIEETFFDLFPMKSIGGQKIIGLFLSDVYDKIMAVFLVLTIVAAFNPLYLVGSAISNGNMAALAVTAFMVVFFILSLMFIKASFSIPGMGIMLIIKTAVVYVCVIDLITAAFLFLVAYGVFQLKKKHENSNNT